MSKSVIVTGGSKGIGWAIVETLARSGYFVVSGSRTYRNHIPADLDSKILQVKVDVKNEKDHEKLVELASKNGHDLVAYINNAGFSEWRPIANIDEHFIEEIIRTNLVGYFWGSKAASQKLENGGSIVNVSSLAGKRGTSNNSAYVATEFGVAGLTQSLCKELGHRGIRVNAVCPVLVETEGLISALMAEHSPANGNTSEFLKAFSNSQSPLLRLPTAQEVANLVKFLISDDASGISGQSINVVAGYSQINSSKDSSPRIAIVIPARLNSQRLPAKALLDVRGLPMLEHVRRRTNLNSFGLQAVVVSGDDVILSETQKNGGKSFESQIEHLNGLSRIGEYGRLNKYDFYVIVQGDEILLLPRHLDALISQIIKNPELQVVNCVTPIVNEHELEDESIVKCIRNSIGEIIFIFRKTPLTCTVEQQLSNVFKINGLFAINGKALELVTTANKQPIETIESIEQMKMIELGLKIHTVLLDKTYPSINVQRDVQLVQLSLDNDQEQIKLLEDILS